MSDAVVVPIGGSRQGSWSLKYPIGCAATAIPETLSPAEDGSGDPRALMMQ